MPRSVDHPFAIVPAEMLSEVKATSVVVYAVLAEHANADQECWPSVGRIARRANVSPATVRSACRELEDAGWITVRGRATDDGRQTSNLYFIRRVRRTGSPQKTRGTRSENREGPSSKSERRTRPNELDRLKQRGGVEPRYPTASETKEMLDENRPTEPTEDPSASVRRLRSALDTGVRAGRPDTTND